MRRLFFLLVILTATAFAQYTQVSEINEYGGPQEFAARRAELAKKVGGKGTVLLFARVTLPESSHYREDNDFFYYTGLREPGAAMLMDAASGRTTIFQPAHSEREIQVLGKTILAMSPQEREAVGFPNVMPITDLDNILARLFYGSADSDLWIRLGFPDKADGARLETGLDNSRHYNDPYGADEPSNLAPANKLHERYPAARLHDLTPLMDEMRNIKRPSEIEMIRRCGKLGAAGDKAAISKAHPGMMQYEVEAEAAYVFRKGGAEGWAYDAIVGSGADANTWHYFSNRHKINAGDVVVFDFAPDLHQMTMDITRTFPIDGKFTPEQAKWYQADLESQKAVIDLLKPGNTYEQAAAAGKAVYDKYQVPKIKGADGVGHEQYPMRDGKPMISGHWVGLATHDVSGPLTGPIKVGQVLTVEPIIEIPEKHWHFRTEDTILITEHGPEVLSSDVPKELVDVEKLVGSALK
jgi:Xaa-Pro aminopeptidase